MKIIKKDEYYCYEIEKKVGFEPIGKFSKRAVQIIFDFAYNMAFGEGHHRKHRSGGEKHRGNEEVFINTFQGKLAELAVIFAIKQNVPDAKKFLSDLDLNVEGKNIWDDCDIALNNKFISIKSTKHFGNLFLLETKDWNEEGEYNPNKNDANKISIFDYFVLVRIKPSGENVLKKQKMLDKDDIDKEELRAVISSEKWYCDIPGYLTRQDVVKIIHDEQIIPKGAKLNCSIEMDADNYYAESGELRKIDDLFGELSAVVI